MLRVGLTGGIASGKSHVSRVFAEMGCIVYDSDQIARDLVAPETAGLKMLVEEFGREILAADGSLDRARLGSLVFSDELKRQRLNQLLHPLIIAEQDRLISTVQDPDSIVIIDAALIIETGSYKRFDVTIVVYCDREEQLLRLMKRNGYSRKEAEARINSQMTTEEKLKYADYAIDTSGSFEQTRALTKEVYLQLRKLQKLKTNASDAIPLTETTT